MKNKWVWIIVGVFVFFVSFIVGIVILFYNIFGNINRSVATPIETQLTDLKKGDYNSAYNLFSNLGKKNMSLDQFKKFTSANSTLLNYKTDFFADEKILNDQATLQGTITGGDGTKLPVEYRLVNENGSWKILSIMVNSPI